MARRNPFTGRISYVDPAGPRALRSRVPRPILAAASLAALAAGIAVSGPSGSSPSVTADQPPPVVQVGDGADPFRSWASPATAAVQP